MTLSEECQPRVVSLREVLWNLCRSRGGGMLLFYETKITADKKLLRPLPGAQIAAYKNGVFQVQTI